MAINKSAFMKELKTWTKPAKGLVLTPGKAIYHLGKAAVRHPYISIAAGLLHGGKKAKWAKRRKWHNTPLAGKDLTKWYL
jgi:hypothetical protein